MFYLLDGRICPMLPLDQFDENGRPLRAVYFYKSTEGLGPVETRTTASLVRVPDDNGASWTPQTTPHGAHFYVEVGEGANLSSVLSRLVQVKNRRDAILAEVLGGSTHGPAGPAEFDPADINKDGIVTKQERKQQRG